MSKKDIKGISQLNLHWNFSKINNSVFDKAGLSPEDIEWIKKRIAKNPKGFLFDFKELDKENKLSNNYFVFQEESDLAINKKDKDNHLLIEGDNYEALLALKATGTRVDVVYIDPPYNTGKEFIYSDDYSTNPKPVGNDDVHKHSKWLSFMKKRLILAKELLTDEGVIFVSIDDNEQAYLKVLMDEIFREDNFVGNINWMKGNAQNDAINIQKNHEYILCYSQSSNSFIKRIEKANEKTFKDENGEYYIGSGLTTGGAGGTLDKRPNLGTSIYWQKETNNFIFRNDYNVETAKESVIESDVYESPDILLLNQGYECIRPPKKSNKLGRWTWDIEKFKTTPIVIKGRTPRKKVYFNGGVPFKEYNNIKSFIELSSSAGTKELNLIFNEKLFDNPKPSNLIKYLFKDITGSDNFVYLDFFAGSGTTGQAVMELNREDNGNRRFILVTNNERSGYDTKANPEYGIARAVTRERLFRVINGKGSNNEVINWELPKELQKENKKYLSENSVNYLKVKTIHKVNGEFEEIDDIKDLYNNEFNKENFSIVELENE